MSSRRQRSIQIGGCYRQVSLQWNLSVTTTFILKFITCDLFSNVFYWRLVVPIYSCLHILPSGAHLPRWAPESRDVSHKVVVIDRFHCTINTSLYGIHASTGHNWIVQLQPLSSNPCCSQFIWKYTSLVPLFIGISWGRFHNNQICKTAIWLKVLMWHVTALICHNLGQWVIGVSGFRGSG